MAAKSIIEINVDDSKFMQFKSVFDDYKKSLEETPTAWSDANTAMGSMAQSSESLVSDAEKRLSLLQAQVSEESKADKELQKQDERRKKATEDRKKNDLAAIKRWKELTSVIAGATVQLVKFASIGMGLATGAATLGFGKLANDASAARFQSMGLGMSSGVMQSANINYSSALSNPSANLAAVRDAQQDLAKQKLFAVAGIGNYQNKSTQQLLPELMLAAQKMAKQTSQGQLAQTAQAYGYTDVFSMEDLTRFKQMSESEMQAMIARAKQDDKALAVNDSTLKSYQDLQKQWDRFGQSMENTWIKGLEPLAPALTRFSEAINTAFDKLMMSGKLEPLINKLADGITKFSAYITSPEAEKDFAELVKNIKEAAACIGALATWIGSILPDSAMSGSAVTGAAAVGGGILAAGAAGSLVGGAALPVVGAAAAGGYLGYNAYQNDSADKQEWAQKIVGGIAAMFGDKDAIAAQKQIASYTESSDKTLKNIKPMTAEEFKKAEADNQGSFINGLGEKFKSVMTEVWTKTQEVAGEAVNGIASAVSGTANASSEGMTFKGGDKANYAMQKLMAMGWSKEQAAGIAANLHRESGFKADIVGDKGAAYGIGQWHKDRQKNFEKVFGHSIKGSTLDEQLKFVDWELRNTERGAGTKLAGAGSAREAGAIVSKYYERPRDTQGEMSERGGFAEVLAKKYASMPQISQSDYKGTPFITKKDENGNLITVKQQKIKDNYALRKPTADQQKSVMFQDQGGLYSSNANRVNILINNSTGGSATASAVSL